MFQFELYFFSVIRQKGKRKKIRRKEEERIHDEKKTGRKEAKSNK